MKNMKVKTFLLTIPLLFGSLLGCNSTTLPVSEPGSSEAPVSSETPAQPSSTPESKPAQSSVPAPQSSVPASEPASTPAPTGTVKIKFWHTFGQTIVDGLKGRIAEFQRLIKENDGVDVVVDMKYQGGYDDLASIIRSGYSVQNVPTIAVAYPDHVSDYLDIGKSDGVDFVANLDPYIESDKVGFGKEKWLGDRYDEEDFIEDFYAEGSCYTTDGTYSLPFLKSTEIMFYNMDLLVEVMKGYKPELNSSQTLIANYISKISWDEFMDICSYVKAHQADISNMLEIPAWYDSDANFFITKMYQNKIPYSSITADGKGKIDFEEQENFNKTVDMLDGIRQNFADGLITTKGIKKTYGSDFFTNEKCVFSIGSSGGSGYNFPQADAFTLGVCRVPASNNNPIYVTQGPTLAMFNDNGLSAADNEAAKLYGWKFMKYITNGQMNAEICVNGSEGYVPVRYSAYETSFFQTFMEEGEKYAQCYKVVVNDIDRYLVSPAFKGSADLRDECGTMLTSVLRSAASKADIPAIVNKAINDAKLKMN